MNDITLRPYQDKIVQQTVLSYEDGNKNIIIQAPTGAGKSIIAATLADYFTEQMKTVAILVKHTALIDQIAAHLNAVGVQYGILKAGMEDRENPEAPVQLIMVQTAHARLEGMNLTTDVVIIDEVHVEWKTPRIEEVLARLNPEAVIGMSATPWDMKGYRLEGTDDLVRVVDERDLTEAGFLAPLKYFVPKWSQEIDYDSLKSTSTDYTSGAISELIGTPEYAGLVAKSMKAIGAENKKTIVFANDIAHCELLADTLKANGFKAYAYHSQTPKALQDAIMESFRSGTPASIGKDLLTEEEVDCRCLVSVMKVSIGFDVPDLEVGVMCRPTKVLSLWRQQLGRICRFFPGKEHGIILDLCGGVARLGFHDDPYNPPKYGDRKELRAQMERLQKPVIDNLAKEEPTEITREIVFEAVEELKRKERDLQNQDIVDVMMIFETTLDVKTIIAAACEINRRKTGKPWTDDFVEWCAGPWIELLDLVPSYERMILKAMKTRLKNIVRDGKKIAAIYYFCDWLSKNNEYLAGAISTAKAIKDANYEEPREAEDDEETIDIDEDDIPF